MCRVTRRATCFLLAPANQSPLQGRRPRSSRLTAAPVPPTARALRRAPLAALFTLRGDRFGVRRLNRQTFSRPDMWWSKAPPIWFSGASAFFFLFLFPVPSWHVDSDLHRSSVVSEMDCATLALTPKMPPSAPRGPRIPLQIPLPGSFWAGSTTNKRASTPRGPAPQCLFSAFAVLFPFCPFSFRNSPPPDRSFSVPWDTSSFSNRTGWLI